MKTFSEALLCAASCICAYSVLAPTVLLPRYILEQWVSWRESKHITGGSLNGFSDFGKNSADCNPGWEYHFQIKEITWQDYYDQIAFGIDEIKLTLQPTSAASALLETAS